MTATVHPAGCTPSRIVVLSDVHEDLDGIAAVAPALAAADLVILAGDLTRRGGREAARRVVEAVRRHAKAVLAVHGNCDRPEALAYLEDEGLSLHRRAVRLGDLAIFGVGGSNLTPMRTPSEYPEDDLARFLAEAAAAADATGAQQRLAVVHCPPRGTALDRMFLGLHVGSTAVRDFLARAQPDASVSGHVHESRGAVRLGRTLAVNPGGFTAHWRYADLTLGAAGFRAELRQSAARPSRIARAVSLLHRVTS
ncbi:MAG: metallophosphoesterase [Myxococcota bacterium]